MPAPCPDAVRPRRRRAAALLLCASLAAATLATPTAAHAAELLKRGSHGSLVARLQQRLEIPPDGIFGPQTARAVRRFQTRKGLVADGVVGPQTAAALGLGGAPAGAAGHIARELPPILERIAACESGSDPRAVSADGTYRGKYQFSRGTWRAMGGNGDPARATETEQDRRALTLLRARGTAPWPSCG